MLLVFDLARVFDVARFFRGSSYFFFGCGCCFCCHVSVFHTLFFVSTCSIHVFLRTLIRRVLHQFIYSDNVHFDFDFTNCQESSLLRHFSALLSARPHPIRMARTVPIARELSTPITATLPHASLHFGPWRREQVCNICFAFIAVIACY